MKGKDLLKRLQSLTPEQLELLVGHIDQDYGIFLLFEKLTVAVPSEDKQVGTCIILES